MKSEISWGRYLVTAAGLVGALETAVAQSNTKPTIASDSIYRLAVDSTKYQGVPFVYLLDDGVIKLESNGSAVTTYHQIIQILAPDAVERWAEHALSFDPDREKMSLNWARVVSLKGEVLSGEPAVRQEAEVPAALSDPVYQRRKVLRITLAKVAPGTLVDLNYTKEDLKPYLVGDFHSGWRVTTGLPVLRSRLMLNTPANYEPNIKTTNFSHPTTDVKKGGRRIRTWAVRDVPKVDPEPFASDSNGVSQGIEITGRVTWQAIGTWYAGLAKDRYELTPALKEKARSLVAGAKTLDDSLRAIHKFVTKEVRYVSVSLGIGGYQPRQADQVASTGFGDCKDKATLFIAMARFFKVNANPVLLHATAAVDREQPTISAFNHAIAAIDGPKGRMFVDLTASDEPLGALPPNLPGQFVLVINQNGKIEETTIPERPATDVDTRLTVTGAVDTSGVFHGVVDVESGGTLASVFRGIFGRPGEESGWQQVANALAARVYPDAVGDSLTVIESGQMGGNPRFKVHISSGRAAQLAGNAAILSLPYQDHSPDLSGLIRELNKRRPRRFPIDVEALSGGVRSEMKVELELPTGWTVQTPAAVHLESALGKIDVVFAQKGRLFTMTSKQLGGKGLMAPDRVDEVTAWLTKMQAVNRTLEAVSVIRN